MNSPGSIAGVPETIMPRKAKAKRAQPSQKQRKVTPAVQRGRAPAARSMRTHASPPVFYSIPGGIGIRHREFVGDVISDVNNDFAYDVYSINPADPLTFPWLSAIAVRWKNFRFMRFVAQYRGGCATSTDGKALLAVDYDAKDTTGFETKAALLNYDGSESASIWDSFDHVSTGANLRNTGPWRFVDFADVGESETDRFASCGNLYVATTAISGVGILAVGPPVQYTQKDCGELFVEYDVQLMSPVLHATGTSELAQFESVTTTVPNTSATNTDVLSGLNIQTDSLGLTGTGLVVEPARSASRQIENWAFTTGPQAGTVVPSTTVLIKSKKDFTGSINFQMRSPNIAAVPSPSVVTASATANASGASGPNPGDSPVKTVVTTVLSDIVPSATGYFINILADVVIAAGSAIAITSPNFAFDTSGSFCLRALYVARVLFSRAFIGRYAVDGLLVRRLPIGSDGISEEEAFELRERRLTSSTPAIR